jgi:hypothetical protein
MDVTGALKVVIRVDDGIVKDRAVLMCNLMRDLVNGGAPVALPTVKYNVPAKLFAAKIRESDQAKAAFAVDLVYQTVDFANGAHRSAAAQAEAARSKSAAWK